MSGLLTHTVSQIIRQLLIDNELGSNSGNSWPVYAVQEPDSPDNIITTYDTVGVSRGRFQIGGEIQEVHGIQIRIRSNDAQVGWKKSQDVKLNLSQSVLLTTVTVTDPEGYGTATQDYIIYNISHRSGPLPIPDSDSDRKIHTLNIVVTVRES
jgi:hypothetical protein